MASFLNGQPNYMYFGCISKITCAKIRKRDFSLHCNSLGQLIPDDTNGFGTSCHSNDDYLSSAWPLCRLIFLFVIFSFWHTISPQCLSRDFFFFSLSCYDWLQSTFWEYSWETCSFLFCTHCKSRCSLYQFFVTIWKLIY